MEKLEIPERYRKPTRTRQTTETDDFDRLWELIPYRPLFNCPKCKAGGFLYPCRPDGSVNYSQLIPCDHPGCYGEKARAYKYGQNLVNSGVIGTSQTFENFDPEVKGVRKSYKYAWDISEGIGDFIWLLMCGGTGCGKTHLLNAIANRAMERGYGTRMVMMADLLSELRMAIKTNQTDEKIQELKQVPYLLIDEIGLEYGTAWEKEKIDELLTIRWANGRFTIAATNLDIEQLPERIKSRFKDRHLSRWVKNEAGDYRVTKGSK